MAVKGQVLVDLIAEYTKELAQVGSKEVAMPEERLKINMISPQQTWQLFVNRAANKKGLGVQIVIISP